MSQDVIADALNNIMNAKKRGKKEIVISRHSKFLLEILSLVKKEGYIKSFESKNRQTKIEVADTLNKCQAIKPRFFVKKDTIDKYVRRYLPARDFGFLIVSTNKGIMTHKEAIDKKMGGSLIAYFY